MRYATSDLHGYSLDGLLRLMERAGFSGGDTLYILGDVIDRNGDGGVAVLEWMTLQPFVRFLLGNHEDMLLSCAYLFEGRGAPSTHRERELLRQWSYNGAEPTVENLLALGKKRPSALTDILRYLRSAPLYRRVGTAAGELLLVHSGLGGFDPARPLDEYSREELLWHRPEPDERFFEGMTTVLGHTPTDHYGTPGRMYRAATWIDIDVGGAMGRPPMLLRLDDLSPIYAQGGEIPGI